MCVHVCVFICVYECKCECVGCECTPAGDHK